MLSGGGRGVWKRFGEGTLAGAGRDEEGEGEVDI
jgi:hypothetical protein